MECSLGKNGKKRKSRADCLNPYSNGMLTWKFTLTADSNGKLVVLILILMECSLGSIRFKVNTAMVSMS